MTGIPFGQIPDGCLCAWTGAAGGGWVIDIPHWYGAQRIPRERCPVPDHQERA